MEDFIFPLADIAEMIEIIDEDRYMEDKLKPISISEINRILNGKKCTMLIAPKVVLSLAEAENFVTVNESRGATFIELKKRFLAALPSPF